MTVGKAVSVVLEPVSDRNRRAILALELLPGQQDFVASNADSLEEAGEDGDAVPRAIVADGRVVGFLMYDASNDDEANIYRFMIDRREQGRGLGRAGIAAALGEIEGLAHVRKVLICYEPANTAAKQLYASFGFVEQGLDEDGEMIAELDLRR
ncbi:MAG: GNAT family N-acetyltransferase [Aquamicrobium sp.]|uniref:GNAT family N-acetyltransferase n=1 Tax=Mesorhizobium TaxID=68287 RepID=UPI001010FE87|nr:MULTISPECIES: GNAT family N-acetyltransferase [Mesorhizobium]MBR2691481.1 GNAT family N-acetyltransferase [Aquamicrobium sp.]QAZ42862.1 GNAT family N-acetyltransferase [Mesorhizobium sp. Pch-S]